MKNKIAFVYEWNNIETEMKYIGSHFGLFNDGYISSSDYFNSIYKENPSIFERKILFIFQKRIDALTKELEMLTEVDAAKNSKYYNLCNNPGKGWSHHDDYELSKIFYDKISKSKKGKPAHNKGIPMGEEQKKKLSDIWIVTGPNIDGEIEIDNMNKFCIEHNLNPSAMSAVARGKIRHHHQYRCRKITNKRNVEYEYKEWKSKGKSGGVNYGSNNGWSKKVKIGETIYDCMREASEKTGLSLHLIRKQGDFNA
jgi:hypothetical protein